MKSPFLQRLASIVPSWRFAAACAVLAALPLQALADGVMINPTRLVFDKNLRTLQMDLVNPGDKPLTYRITLVNRRMTEDGRFVAADEPLPGEKFADNLLRHSPRQVVLAPREAQVVRVQLRKPAELEAGEYRSHLQFSQVDDGPDPAALAGEGRADEGLQIQLKPLMGMSVPVIVRHGDTSVQVSLSDLSVDAAADPQSTALSLSLHREGNRSTYGDLVATFAPAGGAEQQVGRANGVAVYHPNALRRVRLKVAAEALSRPGLLRVVYRERPEDGGRVLAEGRLQRP